MFSSLKNKFLNVQEEISNSLKNLKLERNSKAAAESRSKRSNDIDVDAGIQILERYQNYWDEIHKKTENAALCASEADEIIVKIHSEYENKWTKIDQLNTNLAYIPQLVHGVQEICDLILNMQCAFDETNDTLFLLEDLIETQELREKQLDNRFNLAIYQEKRGSELENLKEKLADEHLKKVREHEKRVASRLKERHDTFKKEFERDVEEFKSGRASRMKSNDESTPSPSTPSLEEIELEDDPVILEEFLAEQENDDSGQRRTSSDSEAHLYTEKLTL